MLTVAYIGFGVSVCNYHLPYVEGKKDVKVKYIYRREEDRVGDTERESWYPEITFTTNFDDVLNDPEVNLVVVNAPNQFHGMYTKQCIEAGKNVLCEKPFSMTSQEAREIFKLAKEKELVVMSNQNRRFDGDMRTVREVIELGVLGDLVEVESHYDYFRPEFIEARHGMDFLCGYGIHPIDQILSLFGRPKRMVYDVRSIAHPGENDDYVDIDFFYEKGLKATVKLSNYVKIDAPRFTLHGKKGSFIIPPAPHNSSKEQKTGPVHADMSTPDKSLWGTLSYIDNEGNEVNVNVPRKVTDYGLIYDALVDSICNGKEKLVKDDEVICGLEIVEEGDRIAKEAK